jgi:hypothetical protein
MNASKLLGGLGHMQKGSYHLTVSHKLLALPALPSYVSHNALAAAQCQGLVNRLCLLRDQDYDVLVPMWNELDELANRLQADAFQGEELGKLVALTQRVAKLDPVPPMTRRLEFILQNRQCNHLGKEDVQRIAKEPEHHLHCALLGRRLTYIAYESLSKPWMAAAMGYVAQCAQCDPERLFINHLSAQVLELEKRIE